MRHIPLPKTDLLLSPICLGTDHYGGRIPEDTAFKILDHFLDIGGNIIDTANVYGKWLPAGKNASEQVIGRWMRSRGISDDQMLIGTKGGHYDLGNPAVSRVTEKDIRTDLEESLCALGRDHIDIYWLHRDNEDTPIGELLEWLERLAREGKIRYYGASNFRSDRMDEAAAYAEAHGLTGFIGLQNRFSLAVPNPAAPSGDTLRSMDRDFFSWHIRTQTALFPYTSSAHGYFAKRDRGSVPENMKKEYENSSNDAIYSLLCRLSGEIGQSAFVLAQSFLLSLPFPVFPLMAAREPGQAADFTTIAETVIPDEYMNQLLQLLRYDTHCTAASVL